ncbi:TerB family tellurite resistance protein [Nitrogeniibacter mangrovi]|uniref:TerB family tellurite resistance protein n=1 Tax=Nitrogeniibacter mangrovi TaxID=2016596 RepID=A0A6C1B1G6_9RHOO|nr:TerB family tellurite resistance protein [Nitrogeniibacter mangrovi]QID16190.1 TerB family tellurite resistance protein [Nitrogeniibacter mangrovi]
MLTAHDFDAFSTPEEPSPTRRTVGRRRARPRRRPLRHYGRDSGQAQARLLALSLLANGRMAPCEVDVLCDQGGLAQLGLSREDFFTVLYELCADVGRMPALGGGYVLSRTQVQDLLDEITDPTLRERTLEIMYAVMRSDGRLDEGELALLMATLNAWDETRRFPGHNRAS